MDCSIEFVKENWQKVVQGQFVELKKQAEDDQLNKLYQQIDNLEKQFLNNGQTYQQFGHLLMRTLHRIRMYFIDHDIDSNRFDEHIEDINNVLVKREKQLQRLSGTHVLSNYDYRMLEYEAILQHRTIEFNLNESREQSYIALKTNCSDIFDLYIRQCVHFHSTLSVNGICGDLDHFLEQFFGQEIAVNEQERKSLERSFAHFNIPCDNPQIVCRKRSYWRQNQSTYFLPSQYINESIRKEEIDLTFIDLIKSIRNNRWVVLLGSAGSGKTTFAQWLTCRFSQALFLQEKNVIIHGINMGPLRIPILIRIGEFAQWLENHPASNLLDYIGQHTWLGQEYVTGGFEILKDFVQCGHALIILDGLDEVATIELHNRVITLVRVFMQSHCMSHEFVSPFDDTFEANLEFKSDFRREGLSARNLVLITSRILEYTTHPLNSKLIVHYTIQPMSIEYRCSFIQNWCLHVQNQIIDLFIQNVSDLKKNKIKSQSNLNAKILIAKIETNEGLRSLASNLSVLSIICTLFVRHGINALEKTRIQLYEKVIELMLQRMLDHHESNISKDALVKIFSNMAFYIHSHSGSGLIDEFDLINLCRLSLVQWYNQNTNTMSYDVSKIRQQTEQFMQHLNEDSGIIAARALGIYGFLHLTFQEYFICSALTNVNNSNVEISIKELVIRFLSLFSNVRLRESLNLVMGWISLYWSSEKYDDFCIELQDQTNLVNKHIPLGSLWFVRALNDLACLPSLSIVYNILNTLLEAHEYEDKQTYIFKVELMTALDRLPAALVNSWFDQVFLKKDLTIILKILQILYEAISTSQSLPHWMMTISSDILEKQLGLFNEEIDIYVDRTLTMIGAINSDCLSTPPGSMREYLLSRSISTPEIHSSILAALIALFGGLERNHSKAKRQTSIVFTARRIHRHSPLSSLFIEYMDDRITEREAKLKRLIDQCHQILDRTTSTNITSQILTHSLVVLFCFYSNHQSSNYKHYIGSEVWQHAVRHMKITFLYLREFFCINPCSKFKNNLTDILEYFVADCKEEIFDFAKSVSHGYCRLLRANTSFLIPDFRMDSDNSLVVIKMPRTIELPSLIHWNEDKLVRLLPFICCVGSLSCHTVTIEELESEDLNFLKKGIHPFQLLQNKPITLLLAYVPISVQSLYMQLIAQNQISSDQTSILPFLHLLIEFFCVMLTMDKYSIRFCVLLAILLPTIVQHRMENFLLRVIDTSMFERNYKQLSKAYKESYFHPFASVMRIGDYTEEERLEELATIEEQHRIIHAQTDLELYAACCCFARFNDPNLLKIKFDELCTIVQRIKHPVWRLDATINVFCIMKEGKKINTQLQDRYLSLITDLEELEPTIPLLTYVALFVRYIRCIQEDIQLGIKRIVQNILQRLKTVTIAEQQAICETLIAFPSFRHHIIQHTPTTFSKYLSAKFFSTSDIKGIRSTLLTSIHLSELTLYIKFLDDSFIKETCSNLVTPQSFVQKCLKVLEGESLTVEATSMISLLLSSNMAEIEDIDIIQIEQALVKKRSIDDHASSFVLQWLCYRYDKRLCSFAYHGALLLGLSNMWTPTILEICCELLTNDCDYFRYAAIRLIREKKWYSEKQSNRIIINYLYHWNKKPSKWLSEIEVLFDTLHIEMIDEIEQILQVEYERFEISFFRLINSLSSDIQNYIITTMQSLSIGLPDSTDHLFLHWLLEHMPCKLLEDKESFIELLIRILVGSYNIKIKVNVARKLSFFHEKEQIQHVLWNIVINNEEDNSDELIAQCICSLFTDRKDSHLMQKRLKELDYLREHTRSPLIRQATLSAMYFHIITEPEKYDIVDVYYSYMTNAGLYIGSYPKDNGYDRASDWIIKHVSILLPQFIDDMYKSFENTSVFRVSTCIEVATRICAQTSCEFRLAVRQSSIGENAFRKALYEMSKQVSVYGQENYLYIYACFEQVTPDYAALFLKVRFETSWDPARFEQVQFVSERQSIELLFNTLQSSLSFKRRCAAAELLVELTVFDQVSAIEVQKLLTAAIDDPRSQQCLKLNGGTTRADRELRRMLIQLMVKGQYELQFGREIDMVNENSNHQIPAALFSKQNG